MSDDGISIRVKSFATVCPTCIRLCFNGVRSKPSGLLRDGLMHAIALEADDDAALCDGYIGWSAVIPVPT